MGRTSVITEIVIERNLCVRHNPGEHYANQVQNS